MRVARGSAEAWLAVSMAGAPHRGPAPPPFPPPAPANLQPHSKRAGGTFNRGEDGLFDMPQAARYILQSMLQAHTGDLQVRRWVVAVTMPRCVRVLFACGMV